MLHLLLSVFVFAGWAFFAIVRDSDLKIVGLCDDKIPVVGYTMVEVSTTSISGLMIGKEENKTLPFRNFVLKNGKMVGEMEKEIRVKVDEELQ